MSCTLGRTTSEFHGWSCMVTGGECMFLVPDSKACAEIYGEGPDSQTNKCEECSCFYAEDEKRCCTREPLRLSEDYKNVIESKYIQDDVRSCGGFSDVIGREAQLIEEIIVGWVYH